MRFYDCKTAPSPRRVRIFLAEKGIEVETVQIDLGSGEQFGDSFRAINPDCVVPALELDDGSCISDSCGGFFDLDQTVCAGRCFEYAALV